jgi:hypothetical protein
MTRTSYNSNQQEESVDILKDEMSEVKLDSTDVRGHGE